MADVRAMLRAERAARENPAQPYSQLPTPSYTKKRKGDEHSEEARKRPRAQLTQPEAANGVRQPTASAASVASPELPAESEEPTVSSLGREVANADEDDLELAAFLEEMEETPSTAATTTLPVPAVATAHGVIRGKAMTTEDLKAKETASNDKQAGKAEEEVQDEKEDLAREMKEEFGQVAELEIRASRLRNLREQALLARSEQSPNIDEAEPFPGEVGEEDADDDWDGWAFHPA